MYAIRSYYEYQKLVQGESAFWALKHAIAEAKQAEEKLDGGIPPSFNERLEFRDVDFSYGRHPVLKNLSLTIDAGPVPGPAVTHHDVGRG